MNTLEEFENDALDAHARTAVAETQHIASGSTRPSVADLLHTTTAERGSNAKKWGIGLAALSAAAVAVVAVSLIVNNGDGTSPKKVQTATTVTTVATTTPTTAPATTTTPRPPDAPKSVQRFPVDSGRMAIGASLRWSIEGEANAANGYLVSVVARQIATGDEQCRLQIQNAERLFADGEQVLVGTVSTSGDTGQVFVVDGNCGSSSAIDPAGVPVAAVWDNDVAWVLSERYGAPNSIDRAVYRIDRDGQEAVKAADLPAPGPNSAGSLARVGGATFYSSDGDVFRIDGATATKITANGAPKIGEIIGSGTALWGVVIEGADGIQLRDGVRQGVPVGVVVIDPATGAIGPRVDIAARALFARGDDSVFVADGNTVTRLDLPSSLSEVPAAFTIVEAPVGADNVRGVWAGEPNQVAVVTATEVVFYRFG